MEINVGDIVEYINDWKPGRQWYLHSLDSNGLCTIVLMRDDKFTTIKHFKSAGYEWDETYLNTNIVNLDISKLKIVN